MRAPVSDAPAPGASLSSSGFADGLGHRVLAFDREEGVMLERLTVRPELAAFEPLLRERIERIAAIEDERIARPRTIECTGDGAVVVVSEFVPGLRLSDLLENAAGQGSAPGVDAAMGFLLDLLPALCGFHAGAGLAHGAIAPERLILTPAGQVVLLDAVFGGALEHLGYGGRTLWKQFGLAVRPSPGRTRLDVDADLTQATLCAVMLVLGRPLRDEDHDRMRNLLRDVVEVAQIRASAAFARGMEAFLERALPLRGGRPFATADDALIEVRALAGELGLDVCRGALLECISQSEESGTYGPPQDLDPRDVLIDGDERAGPGGGQAAAGGHRPRFTLEIVTDGEEDYAGGSAGLAIFAGLDEPEAEVPLDWPPVEEEASPAFTERPQGMAAGAQMDTGPASAVPDALSSRPAAGGAGSTGLPSDQPPAPVVVSVPPQTGSSVGVDQASLSPAASAPGGEAGTVASEAVAPTPGDAPSGLLDGHEANAGSAPVSPAVRLRRAKRSRSARARKDRLRSAAAPEPLAGASAPPEPVKPEEPPARPEESPVSQEAPASAPEPEPKEENWLVPPNRAAAFEPPVPDLPRPPLPAPPPFGGPVPPAAPLPPSFAAPVPAPPPPAPIYPPAPPVYAPPALPSPAVPSYTPPLWTPPPATAGAPPPYAPSLPAPFSAPVPLKLKEPPPAPRGRRAPSVVDIYAPATPPPPRAAGSTFPWKLAGGLLVLVLLAVVGGRFYLAARSGADGTGRETAGSPDGAVPAAAVPAAAPRTGRLEIETQPPGARVLLDGKVVGATPLSLDDVAPGRRTVTIASAAGTIRRTVRIEAGNTSRIDVPIFSGWIDVAAPFVVQVASGGKVIGTTEESRLMLSPGRHELTLTNAALGYRSVQTIDVEPGEVTPIRIDPRGHANFNAIPWAEVWIDGRKAGETPIARLELPLGTREVIFRHPEFGERRETVTIRADEPVILSVEMAAR